MKKSERDGAAGPRRRAELIGAAVIEIAEHGVHAATVAQIARRAGLSSALAFHYFGDKESLIRAVMRHILSIYGRDVRAALDGVGSPRARLDAIVRASFSTRNFEHTVTAAWLNFYVVAQRAPATRRLLDIYRRRLHSNLAYALRPDLGDGAGDAAVRIAGLIDGLYLRAALDDRLLAEDAEAHVLRAIAMELETPK